MKTVEEAYQDISQSIMNFIGGRTWDFGVFESVIYSKMTQSTWYLVYDGLKNEKSIGRGDRWIDSGGAALLLREDILRTTGKRIWGLEFILYPDGKFKIEYNYDKPEGYEETDETISGDEINSLLSEMSGKNK
ncbi:MAG: hypothetical protein RR855_12290 [Comamonas sp.]